MEYICAFNDLINCKSIRSEVTFTGAKARYLSHSQTAYVRFPFNLFWHSSFRHIFTFISPTIATISRSGMLIQSQEKIILPLMLFIFPCGQIEKSKEFIKQSIDFYISTDGFFISPLVEMIPTSVRFMLPYDKMKQSKESIRQTLDFSISIDGFFIFSLVEIISPVRETNQTPHKITLPKRKTELLLGDSYIHPLNLLH